MGRYPPVFKLWCRSFFRIFLKKLKYTHACALGGTVRVWCECGVCVVCVQVVPEKKSVNPPFLEEALMVQTPILMLSNFYFVFNIHLYSRFPLRSE